MEATFSTELESSPDPGAVGLGGGVHPAIHPRPGESIRIDGPLFDRRGRQVRSSIDVDPEVLRERAMRMHPAGKGLPTAAAARGGPTSSGGDTSTRHEDRRSPSGSHDPDTPSVVAGSPGGSSEGSSSDRKVRPREGSNSSGISNACDRSHHVQSGDTLWSIAADTLKTSDLRRIARYWPKIHRHNLEVIGRNPDLLFPGQVLQLPPECDD